MNQTLFTVKFCRLYLLKSPKVIPLSLDITTVLTLHDTNLINNLSSHKIIFDLYVMLWFLTYTNNYCKCVLHFIFYSQLFPLRVICYYLKILHFNRPWYFFLFDSDHQHKVLHYQQETAVVAAVALNKVRQFVFGFVPKLVYDSVELCVHFVVFFYDKTLCVQYSRVTHTVLVWFVFEV